MMNSKRVIYKKTELMEKMTGNRVIFTAEMEKLISCTNVSPLLVSFSVTIMGHIMACKCRKLFEKGMVHVNRYPMSYHLHLPTVLLNIIRRGHLVSSIVIV